MTAYHIDDYDYSLPEQCIAQTPITPRDQSRLMRLRRHTAEWTHHRFADLDHFLNSGDVLVLNNTQVVPVRLTATKPSGGRIEFFILDITPDLLDTKKPQPLHLQCLVKGAPRRLPGPPIMVSPHLEARVLAFQNGTYTVAFDCDQPLGEVLNRIGQVPLPPYIRRDSPSSGNSDHQTYQTIYARQPGAVAAPTAGLHFTPDLLQRLINKGIQIVYITLHVGYGTFMPVRVSDIRQHALHSENYTISPAAAECIVQAKAENRRIVATGTTCVRTLEDAVRAEGGLKAGSNACQLFIYPEFKFKCVDALITNFHLPRSTLLMLVAAFTGRRNILAAYQEAIQEGYRFFSYGDAMLIE